MVGSSMKVVDVAGQNSQNKVYPNTDIFVCHIDGSNLTQITYHAADDLSPVWSKDGKYIYLYHNVAAALKLPMFGGFHLR